jgi:predicted NUDIX family phosphoesterase
MVTFRPNICTIAALLNLRCKSITYETTIGILKRNDGMAKEEQVLVVERKVVEEVGMFHGLAFDVDRYLPKIFVPGVPRFMPRSKAEKDPSYKQLIPYVIMSYAGRYLSYVRGKRAGETRLLGLRSIGIGGHINPIDADNSSLFAYLYENYLTAVEREVAEEVNVETQHSDRIVALLNDDSNEVGSVHLGVVHYWVLDEPKVSKREQMITQMDFKTLAELQNVRDTMETWSGLCVDGLEKMAECLDA